MLRIDSFSRSRAGRRPRRRPREDVEGAGAHHDVVDLVEGGDLLGHLAAVASERMPTMAGVGTQLQRVGTATIWMMPSSRSRWTRRRTAASESPTSRRSPRSCDGRRAELFR